MAHSNIPTSPKARAEREKSAPARPMTHSIGRRVSYLVFLSLLSFFVGFCGALFAKYYPTSWPLAEFIIVERYQDATGPEVVFVDSNQTNRNIELLDILQTHQRQTIASLYPSDTSFKSAEELGKGVIISNDGWIATPSEVVGDRSEITVLTAGGETYTTSTLVKDNFSGITYIDIKAAQLPVVDFRTAVVELGEPLVVYNSSLTRGDNVRFASVENVQYSDQDVWRTDRFNYTYLLDTEMTSNYLGSPAFDSQGNLVGLYTSEREVIPVEALSNGIYELFATQTIGRSTKVIHYEPVHRSPVLGEENREGAKVTKLGDDFADQDGLKVGDVVTQVNDVALTDSVDLAVALSQQEIGTPLTLLVERSGQEIEVELNY